MLLLRHCAGAPRVCLRLSACAYVRLPVSVRSAERGAYSGHVQALSGQLAVPHSAALVCLRSIGLR